MFFCSFCGKSRIEVSLLIAGPDVYICDECIDIANTIIFERFRKKTNLSLEQKNQEVINNFYRNKKIYDDIYA